ncbi:hypothetical protein DVS28_b0419 (plasmid) [Euzebya pacifica]|uniref:Uncharacterized protein n=1 Tax=Euzebya pacifica TaxID=1608957 RepID=A0A346Y6S0_9ACTN|nr:hypothetical protein DVS28_b0419 [Euzebya pacifica]
MDQHPKASAERWSGHTRKVMDADWWCCLAEAEGIEPITGLSAP